MDRITARTARESIISEVNFVDVLLEIIQSTFVSDLNVFVRSETRKKKIELTDMSPGGLHIKRVNGKHYYDMRADGRDIPITRNPEQVRELARKGFIKASLSDLEKIEHILDRATKSLAVMARNSSTTRLYDRYSTAGIDPLSLVFTPQQLQWIDEPYTPNPFHSENLRYKTSGGIPMRSKSEATFGSRLEYRGIPYRSDDLILVTISEDGRIYEKSYYADFKVPNFIGGISVCEHLGAFNLDTYGDNSLIKLHNYIETGSVREEELFWSFDSTVNDPDKLDALIDRMLLPL